MTTAACSHHWILQPANGPESQGVCRGCGAKRMFRNSFEEGYNFGRKRPADLVISEKWASRALTEE